MKRWPADEITCDTETAVTVVVTVAVSVVLGVAIVLTGIHCGW